MKRKQTLKQRGFTLIELIIVIAIVGVLAAVAIPKFYDLSGSAKTAAVEGVAGALASASANNYAMKSAGVAGGVSNTTCSGIATLLAGGLPSTEYAVTPTTAPSGAANGDSMSCTLTYTPASGTAITRTFTGIYTS